MSLFRVIIDWGVVCQFDPVAVGHSGLSSGLATVLVVPVDSVDRIGLAATGRVELVATLCPCLESSWRVGLAATRRVL